MRTSLSRVYVKEKPRDLGFALRCFHYNVKPRSYTLLILRLFVCFMLCTQSFLGIFGDIRGTRVDGKGENTGALP